MTQELRKLAKRLREGQTHDFTTGYLLDQSAVMDESADAIEALLDRVEKAEKDAERYRWLRERYWTKGGLVVTEVKNVRLGAMCPTEKNLDEAIDSAMEASK